jgi:hypothetical protein
MENPMARRTYARFGLTGSTNDLQAKRIPTLVKGLLAAGPKQSSPNGPTLLKNRKLVEGESLMVPGDEFLALVGTSAELRQLVDELKTAGIKEIKCKSPNELVTWCTRVDANHPDHIASTSTLTLLVIGRAGKGSLFDTKEPDSYNDASHWPWRWFGVTRKGVSMKLDDDFDKAFEEAAQGIKKAAPKT